MTNAPNPVEESGTTLLDVILVLLNRKKLIAGVTFGLAFFIGVVSYLMDPVYMGTARFLVPQSTTSTSALLSQVAGMGSGGILTGLMGVGSSVDMYAGLLKTRAVVDPVVETHDLVSLYSKDRILGGWRGFSKDAARDILADNTKVDISTASGIVTVNVKDKDPVRASDMTNTLIDQLVKVVQELSVTEAGQRRLFFEQQLKKSFEALIAAEDDLKGFQEASGAIQIDEQARAVLGGIATLEAQIAAKEIQIKVMKSYATEQNPDYKRLQDELAALREQRKKLQETTGGQTGNVLIPTADIPSLGTDYLRKMREFKYQETLYLLLLKQYESAKLDEAKDSVTIQVVDRSITPERSIWPKRVLMVLAALFLGLCISTFLAFFLEFIERTLNKPEHSEKARQLKAHLSFRSRASRP